MMQENGMDEFLALPIGAKEEYIGLQRRSLFDRGQMEIAYWETVKQEVATYTHEQAINELINALKIDEKIAQIAKFVSSL